MPPPDTLSPPPLTTPRTDTRGSGTFSGRSPVGIRIRISVSLESQHLQHLWRQKFSYGAPPRDPRAGAGSLNLGLYYLYSRGEGGSRKYLVLTVAWGRGESLQRRQGNPGRRRVTEPPKSKMKLRGEVVNPVYLNVQGQGLDGLPLLINVGETDSLVIPTASEPRATWSFKCEEGGPVKPEAPGCHTPGTRPPNSKRRSPPPPPFLRRGRFKDSGAPLP